MKLDSFVKISVGLVNLANQGSLGGSLRTCLSLQRRVEVFVDQDLQSLHDMTLDNIDHVWVEALTHKQLSADRQQRTSRPHIPDASDRSRRRQDTLVQLIDVEDLEVGAFFDHKGIALVVGEEDLAIHRHRRS